MPYAGEVALLTRHPWVPRRLLDVTEYHQMAEAGILRRDERVELIGGELITMCAIGTPHAAIVNILTRILVMAVGDTAIVSVQNPVRLDNRSEPQPDFALLKPRDDFYRRSPPGPQDVFLLIEVVDSSLGYDRSVKLPLYARAGICEFWIVNVDEQIVEVYRAPAGDEYRSEAKADRNQVLRPEALPDASVKLATLFPLLP
jgi:Uma2 family endonuclease